MNNMCRRVPSPASRVARKIPRLLGLVLLAGLGTGISGLAAFADCPAVCPTTCYYVDNVAGNDSNAGTSPSAAWAHLFHVRAQVYSAQRLAAHSGRTICVQVPSQARFDGDQRDHVLLIA